MRLKNFLTLATALVGLGTLTSAAAACHHHCGACAYPTQCCAPEQCCMPTVRYRVCYRTVVEEEERVCYRPVYRTERTMPGL